MQQALLTKHSRRSGFLSVSVRVVRRGIRLRLLLLITLEPSGSVAVLSPWESLLQGDQQQRIPSCGGCRHRMRPALERSEVAPGR